MPGVNSLDHLVLGPRYFECGDEFQDLTISDPIA